jgi:hypothetical protein
MAGRAGSYVINEVFRLRLCNSSTSFFNFNKAMASSRKPFWRGDGLVAAFGSVPSLGAACF